MAELVKGRGNDVQAEMSLGRYALPFPHCRMMRVQARVVLDVQGDGLQCLDDLWRQLLTVRYKSLDTHRALDR